MKACLKCSDRLDGQIQGERESAIKSYTHARRGEGERGGGRKARKYLERRRILSAVKEETAVMLSDGGATMWIYALFLGLVVISCSGKFDRNPSGGSLTSTARLVLA